MTLKAVG